MNDKIDLTNDRVFFFQIGPKFGLIWSKFNGLTIIWELFNRVSDANVLGIHFLIILGEDSGSFVTGAYFFKYSFFDITTVIFG